MQNKTLRAIGASVILTAVAVAGITQMGIARDEQPLEIGASDTTTTVGRTAPTEVSTTEPAPFVYRVGLLSGITTNNFWAFYGREPSVWNSYVLGPTKPALYTIDQGSGTLEPELAVSHVEPTRDDGRWEAVVELNPDLGWSDGTTVTAHDLVFTFDTVRGLGLKGSWADSFPETLTGVEADGDHVVRIEFAEPPKLADWPHSVGLAPIMPRHVWEDAVEDSDAGSLYDMSGKADVGGGPLTLVGAEDGEIRSEANEGYPLAEPPDTVEYRVYDNEETAVTALAKGETDVVLNPGGLQPAHIEELSDEPGVELVASPGNGIRYLGFNLEREPMADDAFRSAVALLLDRHTPNTGSGTWSLVSRANTQWYDSEAAATIAQRYKAPLRERLMRAVSDLRDAGYEWTTSPRLEEGELVAGTGLTVNGQTPPVLTILTPGDHHDAHRLDYAEGVAETLRTLGFDAGAVGTDFDTVVDLAFKPDSDGLLHYDMYVLGWTLGSPALPDYHRTLFAPDGEMNNTGYASVDFVSALERYENALTVEDAFDALWEMERVLAGDLPYLPLYSSEITEAYRSDRVAYDFMDGLGGIQARLGGIWDVAPVD